MPVSAEGRAVDTILAWMIVLAHVLIIVLSLYNNQLSLATFRSFLSPRTFAE
jgi:hypothetical protein